jgi:hypothetical protein
VANFIAGQRHAQPSSRIDKLGRGVEFFHAFLVLFEPRVEMLTSCSDATRRWSIVFRFSLLDVKRVHVIAGWQTRGDVANEALVVQERAWIPLVPLVA